MEDKPLTELDSVPGDILENSAGDRYLALPNGTLAFIGNKDSRLEGLITKRPTFIKILRRVQLPAYNEPGKIPTFQDDWDILRGITRVRAPLPHGCSCTYDALEVVLKCGVHRVKAEIQSSSAATKIISMPAMDMINVDWAIPYGDDDDDPQ